MDISKQLKMSCLYLKAVDEDFYQKFAEDYKKKNEKWFGQDLFSFSTREIQVSNDRGL
jgi:hypothetical protein